jgi:hypothetical protein
MLDLLYVGLVVLFLLLSWGLMVVSEKLMEGQP